MRAHGRGAALCTMSRVPSPSASAAVTINFTVSCSPPSLKNTHRGTGPASGVVGLPVGERCRTIDARGHSPTRWSLPQPSTDFRCRGEGARAEAGRPFVFECEGNAAVKITGFRNSLSGPSCSLGVVSQWPIAGSRTTSGEGRRCRGRGRGPRGVGRGIRGCRKRPRELHGPRTEFSIHINESMWEFSLDPSDASGPAFDGPSGGLFGRPSISYAYGHTPPPTAPTAARGRARRASAQPQCPCPLVAFRSTACGPLQMRRRALRRCDAPPPPPSRGTPHTSPRR